MGHFSTEHPVKESLLNHVGCVVTWVTWVRGLRGSNFYLGCVIQIFLRGSNFFCVGLCVGKNILPWVQKFYVGQFFLRWSTFIYYTRLFYYTTTNNVENFFASPFPTNLD